MNLQIKKFCGIAAFLLLSMIGFSQSDRDAKKDYQSYPYWIEMMQDPKSNFFETQLAFETYWENREVQKGCGYKPFKRWEAFMQSRVDEFGNKPDPLLNKLEFEKYVQGASRSFATTCEWTELGPTAVPSNGTGQPTGNGRVNDIAFHPTDPNTLYIGAPQGGFWKSTDHGNTWTTTTDALPTLGVSSICVNYNDPQIIYIGTGDRDHSDAPGLGIYKSTDGGINFVSSSIGIGNRVVGKILMHPSNDSILIAATSGGIYRSTDAGASWTLRSGFGNYKDLVFKPGDPNTMYSTYNGGFYRSSDNGQSWTLIIAGIPDAYRMAIAVTSNNASTVYVLATNSSTFKALYKSTDSGLNFTTQSTSPNLMDYSSTGSGTSGQAWYCMDVAADPNSSNTVYVGGVNIFKSSNSAVNWSINAHWVGTGAPAVHADHHTLEFSPINNRLYACHDGGLHYTANGGSSWIDITGSLAIAQVYKIGQSATERDILINGYQDNGTGIYDNGSWRTEIGGDGMECAVDFTNANYMYGELYYGDIRRSTNNGLSFSRIAANGTNGINESGAWVTPFCLSEQDPNTMFIGYDNVWRSTNIKATSTGSVSWTKISANLGGSTSNLNKIEASPANSGLLFVARSNTLYRTTNVLSGTPTWTTLTGSLPSTSTINDIECHPGDANIVYLCQGTEVYRSINQGVSWTNISGTLPNVSMNTLVFEPTSNEALYVGADVGIYFRDATMIDWVLYADEFPANSEVTELEIFKDTSDSSNDRIRAATYGRGLWEAPLAGKPEAAFSESVVAGCAPLEITLTDQSSHCPVTFNWQITGAAILNSSDAEPTFNFNHVGTYIVQLIVANNFGSDTITKQYVIGGTPDISSAIFNETCATSNNGSIDLTVTLDNPPYVYNWSGGQTTEDLSSLNSGNYDVTVTDNSGCTLSQSYVVTDDAQLTATTSKGNVSCNGQSNGTGTVTASGNNAPYSYSWNTLPVQTTQHVTGLSGGIYEVTITDDQGCTTSGAVDIFEPGDMSTFIFPNFPGPGQIQVLVSSGIAPYTYSWSNGETTQTISGVPPGFYFCTVKDYNSCAKVLSTTMTAPLPIIEHSNSLNSRKQLANDIEFAIYPNPNQGDFSIQFTAPNTTNYFLTVNDILGRVIYRDVIQLSKGEISNKIIKLPKVRRGEYLIQLSSSDLHSIKKMIVH